VYCALSFGIYYITDLQGILQHSGGLVMTDKSISTSSVKLKYRSQEVRDVCPRLNSPSNMTVLVKHGPLST